LFALLRIVNMWQGTQQTQRGSAIVVPAALKSFTGL